MKTTDGTTLLLWAEADLALDEDGGLYGDVREGGEGCVAGRAGDDELCCAEGVLEGEEGQGIGEFSGQRVGQRRWEQGGEERDRSGRSQPARTTRSPTCAGDSAPQEWERGGNGAGDRA